MPSGRLPVACFVPGSGRRTCPAASPERYHSVQCARGQRSRLGERGRAAIPSPAAAITAKPNTATCRNPTPSERAAAPHETKGGTKGLLAFNQYSGEIQMKKHLLQTLLIALLLSLGVSTMVSQTPSQSAAPAPGTAMKASTPASALLD